jgi:serine/threonine protein kinase
MSFGFGAFSFVAAAILMVVVPVVGIWLLVKVLQGVGAVVGGTFRLIGGFFGRIGHFVRGMCLDTLHTVGGVLTFVVLGLLSLGNLLIGRPSSARHYAKALEDEGTSVGLSLYRLALGHPVRLLGLSAITDGLERRLPELVSRDPQAYALPKNAEPSFEGYKITGTLPPGGSGARLYLAEPSTAHRNLLAGRGRMLPDRVVIKAFDLDLGSTLPQIVRESRALEAAGRLGLVLEHDLSPQQFHYVMPFVPGETVDIVTTRMHARSSADGLDTGALRKVTAYGADMLATLDRFHREGLWHKDIKPSNLIVSDGRVHVVDLGLVTPLSSAMTLTTHGTEYFRDPELVRLALQGVKVHEVDGVKFDLYSAGAVLFSMVEGSFPAHGSLSRITNNCPQSLSWIIRRSMSDMGSRYPSAAAMNQDLAFVLAAEDPFDVLPAQLPSETGGIGKVAFASRVPDPEPFPTWSARSRAASMEMMDPAAKGEGPAEGIGPVTRAAVRSGYRDVAPQGPRQQRRRTRRRSIGALGLAAFAFLFLIGVAGVGAMSLSGSSPNMSRTSFAYKNAAGFDLGTTPDPELTRFPRMDLLFKQESRVNSILVIFDPKAPFIPTRKLKALVKNLSLSGKDVYCKDVSTGTDRDVVSEAWSEQALAWMGGYSVDQEEGKAAMTWFANEANGVDGVLWLEERDGGRYLVHGFSSSGWTAVFARLNLKL